MDPTTAPSGSRLATASAPALAYKNPQPRLPGSEADPPRQPETFVRRARRVRLGSHHLKTGYLALCTFGRGWVKEEDRIEIRMKRQTMAGELECRPQTLATLLRDLQTAGVVEFCRSKYHTIITVFCEPRPRVSAESAPTENRVGAENAPPVGAKSAPTKVFCTSSQQQQQPDPPSNKQLRGIWSMGNELRAVDVHPFGSDEPQTRPEADETFRERKRQVAELRAEERSKRGRGHEDYTRRQTRQPASLARNTVGRIRNCLACQALDRGAECHCTSCGWRESGCTCDFDFGGVKNLGESRGGETLLG